jgi:hypothetical protein
MAKKLTLYKKEITNACIMNVAVGTTGYCGGDGGHGGVSVVDLSCDGGDLQIDKIGDSKFRIGVTGDAELSNLIKAFEFASKTLKHIIADQEMQKLAKRSNIEI